MTEDTGFAEPEETPAEPETDAEPVEATEPASDEPAPDVPAETVPAPPEPAEDSTVNAPEPLPLPFIPDEGVADWLRAALENLHKRLNALGG